MVVLRLIYRTYDSQVRERVKLYGETPEDVYKEYYRRDQAVNHPHGHYSFTREKDRQGYNKWCAGLPAGQKK